MVKAFWRSFQVAVAMLTRFPAPSLEQFSAEEKGRGLIWFPVIGGLMGLILWLVAWAGLRNVEPILASVILLTVWLLVSELRHLDALAHCISRWMFASGDSDETQQASASHVGVMGVVALVMMMKFSALAVLVEYGALPYILLAPVISRLLVIALIGFTPVAEHGIQTRQFRIEFPYMALFAWLLMAVPLALVTGLPMFVVFVALLLIRIRIMQRNGGITWEAIGASIVLLEAISLFASAVFLD